MRHTLPLLLLLAACGGTPSSPGPDGGAPDAAIACASGTCELPDADPLAPDADPAAPDARSSSPDAPAVLTFGDPCALFDDRCGPGTGCRYTGAPSNPFVCQATGPVGEGGACPGGDGDCGRGLGCLPGAGADMCMRFCDTSAPICGAEQTCYPLMGLGAGFPATTGACWL